MREVEIYIYRGGSNFDIPGDVKKTALSQRTIAPCIIHESLGVKSDEIGNFPFPAKLSTIYIPLIINPNL